MLNTEKKTGNIWFNRNEIGSKTVETLANNLVERQGKYTDIMAPTGQRKDFILVLAMA